MVKYTADWLSGILIVLLAAAGPAWGQVRGQIQGNEHPDPHAPADPAAALDQPAPAPVNVELPSPEARRDFAEALDLAAFRQLAVFEGGRAKIVDTLAREQLQVIYGKGAWKDPETDRYEDPVFTLLDLVLRPSYFYDKPLIHVEVLPVRRALLSGMQDESERDKWLRRGRLAPVMFSHGGMIDYLRGEGGDLRQSKGRTQVLRALVGFDSLREKLLLVSPAPGQDQWAAIPDLIDSRLAAADPVAAPQAAKLADSQIARQVIQQFQKLETAWLDVDAVAANAALAELSRLVPTLNPESYPAPTVRWAERIYNATQRLTAGYWFYFLATVLLLVAMNISRPWLSVVGVSLLGAGLLVHTASILVRMYLAGRDWLPIHNQYESYVAVAWFAVAVGFGLMLLRHQALFGAAAAAIGAITMLIANTMPIPSQEIAPVAGILATSSILKFHVTITLASYGLITLGFLLSLAYLVAHYLQAGPTLRWLAVSLNLPLPGPKPALVTGGAPQSAAIGQADGQGDHHAVHAVATGDAMAESSTPAGSSTTESAARTPGPQRLLADLDSAQMAVLQLAFWLLGVGILLGAYWADHAWGRWWAWDPKETWALITWIVYLIVIHMRIDARRRGLLTAWLSVVGFCVMLWCYWGVNLLLSGLHSYA